MAERVFRFGVIGAGLMGREFASAAARWLHLGDLPFRPEIVAVADPSEAARSWFERHLPGIRAYARAEDLLADAQVEAVYCAVPHHLHADLYVQILQAGKHLMAEKPFGMDQPASDAIAAEIARHPDLLVRCSSEFPFFPGAYRLFEWLREGRFGRLIEIEAGFWHSSDLDPNKPINWKRQVAACGEYGCMGDLGMHVMHLPLRLGWMPRNVRALLSKIIHERPDGKGGMVPCDTWDNAILACEGPECPMTFSMKRIAPGHADTWFLRVMGTEMSAEFSTKDPKRLAWLPYASGGDQVWHVVDTPYRSAYPAITGHIFEFGFSDAILQMWAAFCDELANGPAMRQPLHCATPEEAGQSHRLFTAALQSQRTGQTVAL